MQQTPLDADFYQVARGATFNLTKACEAIRQYYETDSESDILNALKHLLPFVSLVVWEHFPWISDSDFEDITSLAATKYWELLRTKRIKINQIRRTYSFLHITTRRVILDSKKAMQPSGAHLETTDLTSAKEVFGAESRDHSVPWLADISMFIDSFPERIAARIMERNRFPSVTEPVIRYVVVRGLAGEKVAEETLVNVFQIKGNPRFYVNYLLVLFRDTLYELRDNDVVTQVESNRCISVGSYRNVNGGDD